MAAARSTARAIAAIAMSFLVLGLGSRHKVTLDDAGSIDATFPGFRGHHDGCGRPVSADERTLDMIIAVDGPAASGKGTLASGLARHYGLPYLDTGLLYRAVGRAVAAMGDRAEFEQRAIAAAQTLDQDDIEPEYLLIAPRSGRWPARWR